MKKVKSQELAKLAKILQESLALRLKNSELERLEILLNILDLEQKKRSSLIFWRQFYHENPMLFDFIIERA